MADDEDDNHGEIDERTIEALAALKVVTGLLARHYQVCPLCLTFNMANIVSEAEDRGVIHHWGSTGDPADPDRSPEDTAKHDDNAKKLAAMLEAFEAGTKH